MAIIREYTPADLECTARVWRRSGQAEYDYLVAFQELDNKKATDVFRRVIQADCRIWVCEIENVIVGFIAMNENTIDRLYIAPEHQGKGVGSKLIDHAKELYPSGLSLKTHQQNKRACAFYEKRGFAPVGYGVSPAPESMPDVEYQWSGDEDAGKNRSD